MSQSAGITMATAMLSAIIGNGSARRCSHDRRDHSHAAGFCQSSGIKEKLLAAKYAQYQTGTCSEGK